MEISIYAPVWNKYRPVLLKLMSDSVAGPQEYQMFIHEFKAMGEKVKSGYSFSLEASKGKAVNNIKNSNIAVDLLSMLQQSNKAMELMNESVYELSMDRNFVLHVKRKEVKEAVAAV